MKHFKKLTMAMSIIMGISAFSACEGFRISTFEERCVTTEEGFVYYEDKNIGLCLLAAPEVEELTIPEYIDGKRVGQLGYQAVGIGYMEDFPFKVTNVKKLTIQHKMIYYLEWLADVETLLYVSPLDSINAREGKVIIDNYLRNPSKTYWHRLLPSLQEIILLRGDKEFEQNDEIGEIEEIHISNYVTIIEAGVFDGLEGVTIKTSYESKPEGWEDGWSGNCLVEWGVEF